MRCVACNSPMNVMNNRHGLETLCNKCLGVSKHTFYESFAPPEGREEQVQAEFYSAQLDNPLGMFNSPDYTGGGDEEYKGNGDYMWQGPPFTTED